MLEMRILIGCRGTGVGPGLDVGLGTGLVSGLGIGSAVGLGTGITCKQCTLPAHLLGYVTLTGNGLLSSMSSTSSSSHPCSEFTSSYPP